MVGWKFDNSTTFGCNTDWRFATVNLTDNEIFQRVQQGQLGLFAEVVRRHRQSLLRAASSKLGDNDWAEDVVQETFLAAFQARQTFNPQYAFRTWLWTILLNLCRRHLRRSGRRLLPNSVESPAESNARANGEPISADTVLTQVLTAERRHLLHQLLADLPEAQADALRLRFFGGLKYEEIARSMGGSLSGAKLRVKNGLAALAERIRQMEGDF